MQQCLPLAVLKPALPTGNSPLPAVNVATVPTACGIETCSDVCEDSAYLLLHVATVPTACGIETTYEIHKCGKILELQQYLPLAVCDEGCEAAEEQSDDEVCTSLVPDQREGKTKVMK